MKDEQVLKVSVTEDASVNQTHTVDLGALRLAAAEARIAELEAAVRWALGEEGDFGDLATKPTYGQYWWRSKLRALAFGPGK